MKRKINLGKYVSKCIVIIFTVFSGFCCFFLVQNKLKYFIYNMSGCIDYLYLF